MSAIERRADDCVLDPGACEPPARAFDCAYDDPDAPTMVTIYPADADDETLITTWVSAGLESVVALEVMR